MKGFTFSEMLNWYDWEREYWYNRAERYFERLEEEYKKARR